MTRRYDLVLLTEDKYVNTDKRDWYTLQVLLEDELVLDALKKQELIVTKKSWSDPEFDWSSTRAVMFRTTWDYFDRFAEFSEWLDSIENITHCINPASIIRWNLDKRYLIELNQNGINCVETKLLEKGKPIDLKQYLSDKHWQQAIIKPAVSGAARHTYRVNLDNSEAISAKLSSLIENEDFLIQPFQDSIVKQGEISLMVMNGVFTHAVRKVAAQGDFRVQDDHGGSVHPYIPTTDEITFAEAAIQACKPQPLYGRVDIVKDNHGDLAIMELELIEPELFFRFYRPATTQLAIGIKAYLNNLK